MDFGFDHRRTYIGCYELVIQQSPHYNSEKALSICSLEFLRRQGRIVADIAIPSHLANIESFSSVSYQTQSLMGRNLDLHKD